MAACGHSRSCRAGSSRPLPIPSFPCAAGRRAFLKLKNAPSQPHTVCRQFAPAPLLRQKPHGLIWNPRRLAMSEIDLSFEAPLARIRLNSPSRRNAISRAMWRALPSICDAIAARDDALVVVLEGEGGHFSAGAA